MSVKSLLAKPFSWWIAKKIKKWSNDPEGTQRRIFAMLVAQAAETRFGKDHKFSEIKSHQDFIQKVPIRDYEALREYIERVVAGKPDVLWPGKPLYFAKTSGTTSGTKYIPISRESMPFHIQAARDALLLYARRTGNYRFIDGKMIFLQGSPVMEKKNGIQTGRLSGIVAHYVPAYLQKNRLPSWDINCMEDWEKKVEAIAHETIPEDMRLISGIPPWVVMYFERIKALTGKSIGEQWPGFSLFVNGGVAFEPYRAKFDELIGRKVDIVEVYPASEGFIAIQDGPEGEGLLMLLNHGIFYEFVPVEEYFNENPTRLMAHQVECGKHYALVMSTNAGLWAYSIGDTVEVVSTKPLRIKVSGRIKHFISAFGEHVIASEVEYAMQQAVQKFPFPISEYTVAPQVAPAEGLPHHEWIVETDADIPQPFAQELDEALQGKNTYYNDLISGKVLRPLVVTKVPIGTFHEYMRRKGKLGGQNKVPRLTNDRIMAAELIAISKEKKEQH